MLERQEKRRIIPILLLISQLFCYSSSGAGGVGGTSVTGSLCPSSIERIKNVIAGKAWGLSDPLATGYGVLTYQGLGVPVPNKAEVCKFLQKSLDEVDAAKIENVFVISSGISKLDGCKAGALKPGVKQLIEKTISSSGTTQDLFYAIESSLIHSITLDAQKLTDQINTIVKADDSPTSIGYGLWALSRIYKSGLKGVDTLWGRIEDVVAQADEVDGLYLQFEGGLSVTSVVLSGVFGLGDVVGKTFPLTNDQVVKFGNYLVSRRTVSTGRGAWLLVKGLSVLSSNKFAVPVHIGLSKGSNVLSESNKVVSVRAVDLMGNPVDVDVMLESLKIKTGGAGNDAVEFVQGVMAEKSVFKWDLKSKKLSKGFYEGIFSGKAKGGAKYVGLKSSVELKVVGKLGPVTARVGVADSDSASGPKQGNWNDLQRGQKLGKVIDVDANQKLVIRVNAVESLHQVFVVLRSKGEGTVKSKEVAFIATEDGGNSKEYKLELDLTQNAKDLGYNSGVYEVLLVLGDFLVEDSVEWGLGDVNLQVAQSGTSTKKSGRPGSLYAIEYGVRKEIKHEFRKPEQRPPRFLSDTFTVLTLVPLVGLLGMWLRIGANIKNFPVGLSAPAFHIGLGGIFAVYGIFWLKLTMFEALKWMAVPGLLTFISGHRLLSQISERNAAASSSGGGGGGSKKNN